MKNTIVYLHTDVCLEILNRAQQIHDQGLKSFGVLYSDSSDPEAVYYPSGVVFFNALNNQRNHSFYRDAYRAQGSYFREHHDAGFVVHPMEFMQVDQCLSNQGKRIVALMHSHRRQNANFGIIDFKQHSPLFKWHLIISMSKGKPELQPYRIYKALDMEYGITAEQDCFGEGERPYFGPYVHPLNLMLEGNIHAQRQVLRKLYLR